MRKSYCTTRTSCYKESTLSPDIHLLSVWKKSASSKRMKETSDPESSLDVGMGRLLYGHHLVRGLFPSNQKTERNSLFLNKPFILSIRVIANSMRGPVTMHICEFRGIFLEKQSQAIYLSINSVTPKPVAFFIQTCL